MVVTRENSLDMPRMQLAQRPNGNHLPRMQRTTMHRLLRQTTLLDLRGRRMIVLEDFDPAMLVSANKRIHHHERAKVCRYWRELAYNATLADDTFYESRARIVIHYRYPTNHRREVSNLYSFVAKPLVDGLVDAGLFVDDSDQYVIGPDARRDYPNGPHRIRIEINELP